MCTQQDQYHGRCIITAVDGEVFGSAFDEIAAAFDVARGILDAGDVGDLCQTQGGVVAHVAAGAAGHVVEDHRQFDGFGNGLEVLVEPFLRGFVVVGDDGEMGGCADFGGETGQLDGFCCRVGSRAGDDRYTSGGLFDGCPDQQAVFSDVDRGRFTGGSDHDERVGTFGDMPFDVVLQAWQVEAAILVHGRGNGR